MDSNAEGPGFKSHSISCRVTVLGKVFTPIVPTRTFCHFFPGQLTNFNWHNFSFTHRQISQRQWRKSRWRRRASRWAARRLGCSLSCNLQHQRQLHWQQCRHSRAKDKLRTLTLTWANYSCRHSAVSNCIHYVTISYRRSSQRLRRSSWRGCGRDDDDGTGGGGDGRRPCSGRSRGLSPSRSRNDCPQHRNSTQTIQCVSWPTTYNLPD